jgi:hypothetical protein
VMGKHRQSGHDHHQGDEQGRAKFHDAGQRTVEREGRKRSDPTPASQRVTAAHKT